MKRIIALIIAVATLITLASCGSKYEPVPSTEDEMRVVAKMNIGDESYDVNFELYRALFLSNKASIDGGDDTVWSGENSAEYVARINKIIFDKASVIFSAIHTAESLGTDMYSSEIDDRIEEYIRISVEGDGSSVTGHGSYDAYLAALKAKNMNYAVGELMFRYAIAVRKINEYYVGNVDELGESDAKFEVTEEKVREFYYSDDAVRVLNAFSQEGIRDLAGMESLRDAINSKDSDLSVAYYIISCTSVTASELVMDGKVTGNLIGRYSLDRAYYSEYTREAFETPVGSVSDVILVDGIEDGYSDGYYLVYRLEKSEEHLTACYDEIAEAYVSNAIGARLGANAQTLSSSLTLTDNYSLISHSEIRMGE